MNVYVKSFKFSKIFGFCFIRFKYFNGYTWKFRIIPWNGKADNLAVYTKAILDLVFSENKDLNQFAKLMSTMEQLNAHEFVGAAKLYRG